ncbi:DNRLRE domain-containing protein [Candidatus Pacearchaeota archaeon]|nr:DNRLRE domain-containing protein [Candidatus Pacearchaeota archaeon]
MRKKIEITLGFLFLFIFVFFIISTTQTPYGMTGFVIFNSQPNGTNGTDTFIREDFPNANSATATELSIGKTAGDNELRALLQFNISSIPQTDTVLNATIQVYLETATGFSNITVKAYRLTSEWIEAEASWNNRTNSFSWSSIGGDYDSTELDSQVFLNSSGNYYNFTITETARNWVNGSYNNYGIILIASNASAGNFSKISSSDSATLSQRPEIIIEHVANAAPTINTISTDTNSTNPKEVGEDVTFTINWNDIESDNTQAYVCNSSNITLAEGCGDSTFCSTSFASTNPTTCQYTVTSSENTTTSFWVAVCDTINCSSVSSENYFYMNHEPVINLTQPDGGETINQSQGNYSIEFNVSDTDSNALTANIYYGGSQNSTTNTIVSYINLTNYCTDGDSDTATTNNCTYSWNSSGIYGTYYLTIIVNDSHSTRTDSSNSSFDVRSIDDSVPPQITNVQIDSNITSGEQITISATITDNNIDSAWISFNHTSANTTMSNTTATAFSATFIAPAVGTWRFKVYAEDRVEQINDTLAWQEFNVTKPNATSQNQTAPTTALPYHTIKIEELLNATDPLRDVYAYLTTPDGFTFLSDYPQNSPMGNFTANQTKTATWFLSVPLSEETYTLNITYSDAYSNSWNSSNMEIQVTSAIGGYEISVAGYPEVETSYDYNVESYFKQNGIYTNPDSMQIQIYDSTGSLIIGPASMTAESTGIYNYTYSVPAAPNEGIWETIVNATKSGTSYYAHEFWKVVGGPFDVRDIVVDDSTISNLTISLTTENTGGANKDLILVWNLTRTDTDASLDSGSDTFMVSANSERNWTVTPTTTYIGQVKITFIGYYSGTEKAGAFRLFSTTSGNISCGDGTCNGDETCSTCPADCGTCPSEDTGGGGGGGGGTVETPTIETEQELTIYSFEETVNLIKNVMKEITIEIKNTGEVELTDITLNLQNLEDAYYLITPQTITTLKPGEVLEFEISLLIKDFIGEKETAYIITTGNLTLTQPFTINVMNFREYYLEEIEKLLKRIANIKTLTQEGNLLAELKECEDMVTSLSINTEEENYIEAGENLEQADDCLDKVEGKLKHTTITFELGEYWLWIITWGLILILIIILIIIIRILLRKFSVINFLKQKPEVSSKTTGIPKTGLIDERLKKIREKLGS